MILLIFMSQEASSRLGRTFGSLPEEDLEPAFHICYVILEVPFGGHVLDKLGSNEACCIYTNNFFKLCLPG